MEATLLSDKKARDWQRAFDAAMLAVAHYRLNTPPGREKFRELLAPLENAPPGLAAPVVALGDVETWLLLIEKSHWNDGELKELWTRVRQNPNNDKSRLMEAVLRLASTTAGERGAKLLIEMLDEAAPDELDSHHETIVAALESPLVALWAGLR